MTSSRRLLPVAGIAIALALQLALPNSTAHPVAKHAYYTAALFIILGIYLLAVGISYGSKKCAAFLDKNGAFYFGTMLFIAGLNLLTAKFAVFPVLFFPSYDNILGIFVETYPLLLTCVFFSFRLLFVGVFCGILIGFITGVLLGFNKKFFYWVNPLTKILGPIPATAWIPIVLTAFPTTFQASAFIIGLSVWFPVTVMTSSGIQNVPVVYFEVGKTLGAKKLFQIFRIGIPAALPSIFQGIFYGICSAFIALMTAEMFGAKYGIGWYISWQKSMVMYSGVYAGLIMIAVFCSLILALLFKVRGKLLAWQKGLINW